MSGSAPIKPPAPRPAEPARQLVLPRRRSATAPPPLNALDPSAAARELIRAAVSATRVPFADSSPGASHLTELERTLRQLELHLAERERTARENEARLADRERELAEMEALLVAWEELMVAGRHRANAQAAVSPEEKAALDRLRRELERQEASLKEAKSAVREREQFLDTSEAKLFEKVQAQQEKENELEQREEDLQARLRRVREREAALDPQAAAALKAEDEAARKRDEFRD